MFLFNLGGYGQFDMGAGTDLSTGKLIDPADDGQRVAMALAGVPSMPAPAFLARAVRTEQGH